MVCDYVALNATTGQTDVLRGRLVDFQFPGLQLDPRGNPIPGQGRPEWEESSGNFVGRGLPGEGLRCTFRRSGTGPGVTGLADNVVIRPEGC